MYQYYSTSQQVTSVLTIMGNDLGIPSVNLIKSAELFPEYTSCKLMDVRESATFYLETYEAEKRTTVNKEEFDEV